MTVKQVHLIYFSPTHTSRSVGRAIVKGMGISFDEIDLTGPASEGMTASFGPDELAVVVVPVYAGHVAPLAVARLQGISGKDTPCVAVVVYGNRAYEHALVDLDHQLSGQGFRTIACATFVGEHSYSTARFPVSQGRPDASDLDTAASFGCAVLQKVNGAETPETLYGVDVRSIRRPKQPVFPLLRFIWLVIRLRKSGTPMPVAPQVPDPDRCTHCGACVRVCPNRAIEEGDELHTRAEACTRCCACVKVCPQEARRFDSPFGALLSRCFQKQKLPQTLL